MTLPLFDLPTVIRKYNQDLNKKPEGFADIYHEQETFGFSGFKKLKQYHSRLQTINDAPDLFLFTKEESDYHRKRIMPSLKQLRERLGSRRWRSVSTTPAFLVPENSLIENSLRQKQGIYHWQARYHRYLTTLNWENVASQVVSTDQWRFKALRATWEGCGILSRCTNEAVLFLADHLPPVIQDYQTLKKEYIKKSNRLKHIPPAIQEAYLQHLTAVESQAEKMLERVAAVMLAKLQTWDATQGNTSTLFMYFHEQFKSMGIETPVSPTMNDSYTFTVDHFLQFHRFIERYGANDVKRQLKKLPWFQNDSALPVRFFDTTEGQFIVPLSVEQYVPLKKPYFTWLFRGEALRYEYFKAKTLPLASLKKMLTVSDTSTLTYVQANEYLQSLETQEKVIKALRDELDHPPYSNLSILYIETRECFKKWRLELATYQTRLLEKKIEVAEKLIQSIQSECELWKQDSQGLRMTGIPLDWNTCNQIELLLIELSLKCTSTEHSKRLECLQKSFDSIRALNRCFDSLQQLSQGHMLKDKDKKDLLQFYSDEKARNSEDAKSFLAYCQPRIDKVLHYFEIHLKNRPQIDDAIFSIEAQITQMIDKYEIIQQLGDEKQRQNALLLLKKKLPLFFLRYLEVLMTTHKDTALRKNQPLLLEHFERLFSALGNDVWQGTSNYHQLSKMLQQYRLNHQWNDIEVKAGSLINVLSKKLLLTRLEKDCKTLDTALFTCTEEDKAVGYSEAQLQYLKEARDKAVAQKIPPSSNTCLLPLVPRGPMDETHPKVKHRHQFYGFSIRANQEVKKIRQQTEYTTSVSMARLLGNQFEKLFIANPTERLKKDANKSRLFTKAYLDPEVEKTLFTNS